MKKGAKALAFIAVAATSLVCKAARGGSKTSKKDLEDMQSHSQKLKTISEFEEKYAITITLD